MGAGAVHNRVGSKDLKKLVVWLGGWDPHLEEADKSSIQTLAHLRNSQDNKVPVGRTQEGFSSNWDLS